MNLLCGFCLRAAGDLPRVCLVRTMMIVEVCVAFVCLGCCNYEPKAKCPSARRGILFGRHGRGAGIDARLNLGVVTFLSVRPSMRH